MKACCDADGARQHIEASKKYFVLIKGRKEKNSFGSDAIVERWQLRASAWDPARPAPKQHQGLKERGGAIMSLLTNGLVYFSFRSVVGLRAASISLQQVQRTSDRYRQDRLPRGPFSLATVINEIEGGGAFSISRSTDLCLLSSNRPDPTPSLSSPPHSSSSVLRSGAPWKAKTPSDLSYFFPFLH